jgi:hypothetical protein
MPALSPTFSILIISNPGVSLIMPEGLAFSVSGVEMSRIGGSSGNYCFDNLLCLLLGGRFLIGRDPDSSKSSE